MKIIIGVLLLLLTFTPLFLMAINGFVLKKKSSNLSDIDTGCCGGSCHCNNNKENLHE